MKRITLVISIFLLIFSLDMVGQNCGAPTSDNPDLSFFDVSNPGQHGDYRLRLYFHIVRDNNGQGNAYPSNRIPNNKSIINNAFNPLDIYFDYDCKIRYLDNTDRATKRANSADADWCEWQNIPMPSDGINIFIVSGFSGGSFSGSSDEIPGRFIVLNGGTGTTSVYEKIESTTVVHELGHLFGLLHMFHGSTQNQMIWEPGDCVPFNTGNLCGNTFLCPYSEFGYDCASQQVTNDTNECAEDDVNGLIAGDYIADTPPSHSYVKLHGTTDCAFDPNKLVVNDPDQKPAALPIVDPNGDPYDPDVTNFMSFIRPKSCRDHFTDDQAEVMKNHIQAHPVLQPFHSTRPDPICECTYDNQIHIQDASSWSQIVTECNLDPSSIQNVEIIVENTLTIDINYEFRGVSFIMAPASQIYVDNSATMTTRKFGNKRTTYMPCSGTWGGVVVYNNSTLESLDTDYYSASTAISGQAGSNLTLTGNVILNSNYRGVYLNEVSSLVFNNNKIIGGVYGIHGTRTSLYLLLENSEILDVITGVYLYETSAVMDNLSIDANTGISLLISPVTIVQNSNITFSDTGIRAWYSNSLLVTNTNVGNQWSHGSIGIDINVFNFSRIFDNPRIYAEDFGIRTLDSQIDIIQNNIHMTGTNLMGGGVQLTGGAFLAGSGNSQINNNYVTVNQSSFGIETVFASETDIMHNEISGSTVSNSNEAAIRTMGSNGENINNNVIVGQGHLIGILAQNSSGNQYTCNELAETGLAFSSNNLVGGLFVQSNSDLHTIRGNKFYSCFIDFLTLSELSEQEYHGNEFYNGRARAIGLCFTELQNSRFFVNPNLPFGNPQHMPEDPVPDNDQWFVPSTQIQTYFDGCSTAGPDWVPFGGHDGSGRMANYIARKTSETASGLTSSEIDLLHLKLLLSKQEETDGMTADLPVGSLDFVLESKERLSLSAHSTIDKARVRQLQGSIVMASGASSSSALDELGQYIADNRQLIQSDLSQTQAALSSEKDRLSGLVTTGELAGTWREVMVLYIDELLKGFYPEQASETTFDDLTSKLCSDAYGDAIHLSRALANRYNKDNYDVYDTCLELDFRDAPQELTTADQVTISNFPNPTTGTTELSFSKPFSGKLTLHSLSGEVVFQDQLKNSESYTFTIESGSGIYLMEIKESNGDSHKLKITVIN